MVFLKKFSPEKIENKIKKTKADKTLRIGVPRKVVFWIFRFLRNFVNRISPFEEKRTRFNWPISDSENQKFFIKFYGIKQPIGNKFKAAKNDNYAAAKIIFLPPWAAVK